MAINKYALYEEAVQTPEIHLDFIDKTYREINGKRPLSLREDFCGTHLISSEWVRSHEKRTAYGLDLDPEPLAYGKKHHVRRLTPNQKKRIETRKKNVLEITRPLVDVCLAGNFSFYIFKEWTDLTKYCSAVFKSLKKDGLFILEMAGGPGFVEEIKDRRRISKNGKPWFTYIWHQKSFDPVHHHGLYSIGFKMYEGRLHEDVFTYDWRVWTIPEVRAAMKLAGFSEIYVYWDQEEENGANAGVYKRVKTGDNDHAWISYIVGLKAK